MTKVIFIILILTSAVFPQTDWKLKDFDQWTAVDVENILNKSDWVKKQEASVTGFFSWILPSLAVQKDNARDFLSRDLNTAPRKAKVSVAGASTSSAENGNPTIEVGGISSPLRTTITMKLRSSLAIRLALIRQLQLAVGVNKLNPEEKYKFLKKQRGLFECPACGDNYVITISSLSTDDKRYDLLYNSLQHIQLEDLKKYIYLQNDKGEKRELVHFVAPKQPGDETEFFFKRFDIKGNPLLTKDNKFFLFRLEPYEVNSSANFKIEVKPLIVGEKIDF